MTESALVKLAQEGNYKNLNVFPKASSNEPPKQTSNPAAGFMGWFSRRPVTSNPPSVLTTEDKVEANDEKIEPINATTSIDLNTSVRYKLLKDCLFVIPNSDMISFEE